MNTYVTANQFEQLCLVMADAGVGDPTGGVNDIGIYPSVDPNEADGDRVDFQDIRSMAAELGEHIALRFSGKDDVRYERPWLTIEQADEIAERCADHFDYEYRGDVIEGCMRYLDLPVDPPKGWFEWQNEHGDTVWATWTTGEEIVSHQHGWHLDRSDIYAPVIRCHGDMFANDHLAFCCVDGCSTRWATGDHNPHTRAGSKALAAMFSWAS